MNIHDIKNGDMFVTKKSMWFLDEGTVVIVSDVNDKFISFTFGENCEGNGCVDFATFTEHFERATVSTETPVITTVTQECIDDIIAHSTIETFTVFDKCTVVACKLPNGFVIVESSACVSPENYDKAIGFDVCMSKIINKVWELEGYMLQEVLSAENCDCCCECCECEEEVNECLDTDLDCDDCQNCDCKYNPNR